MAGHLLTTLAAFGLLTAAASPLAAQSGRPPDMPPALGASAGPVLPIAAAPPAAASVSSTDAVQLSPSGTANSDAKPDSKPSTISKAGAGPKASTDPKPSADPKPAADSDRSGPKPKATTSPSRPASAKSKTATSPVKTSVAAKTPPEPIKLSDDPRPTLGPETFVATMNAANRYRAIVEAGGWQIVVNEAILAKPGDRGPTVAALRQRLALEGDLPEADQAGDSFDAVLGAAIKRFQLRHGLSETGIVGPRTLARINVPAQVRLRALQASANRLIGSKFPFGERYVAVNIPAATVEAVERGTVARRYVAVVGKPDRASPMVETRVTSVNLNPTWTVPVSLIRKDIIPHVRKDPNYLAKMKIRLFDASGQEIDPGTLDWSTERAVNYTIRQDSGVTNSLGEVRIDMPNKHSVYMHDTPSKRLFARDMRFHSSGCVRVSDVKGLAAWLLEGTGGPGTSSSGWGPAEIEAGIAAGRRLDVKLSRPVPVVWTYLTGYGTPDGTVHFRDDIYGLDEPNAPITIESLVTSSIEPATRR